MYIIIKSLSLNWNSNWFFPTPTVIYMQNYVFNCGACIRAQSRSRVEKEGEYGILNIWKKKKGERVYYRYCWLSFRRRATPAAFSCGWIECDSHLFLIDTWQSGFYLYGSWLGLGLVSSVSLMVISVSNM
jgi:hypothetical protein